MLSLMLLVMAVCKGVGSRTMHTTKYPETPFGEPKVLPPSRALLQQT